MSVKALTVESPTIQTTGFDESDSSAPANVPNPKLITSKKTVTVDKSDKDYKNISFTKRIKLSGAGSESARAIAFKTAGESKVKIYATSSDTDTSRLIKIIDKNGNDVTSTAKIPGSSLKSVSFRLDEAGEYYIVSESGGVNIYYVEVSNGIAY